MVKIKEYIGSYGIIVEDDEIILIKKGRGGYKGKLGLPGGGIEHNETPIVALKREIMEEVGLEVTNCELYDVVSSNISWKMPNDDIEDLHHIGDLYLVKAKGKIKSNPEATTTIDKINIIICFNFISITKNNCIIF